MFLENTKGIKHNPNLAFHFLLVPLHSLGREATSSSWLCGCHSVPWVCPVICWSSPLFVGFRAFLRDPFHLLLLLNLLKILLGQSLLVQATPLLILFAHSHGFQEFWLVCVLFLLLPDYVIVIMPFSFKGPCRICSQDNIVPLSSCWFLCLYLSVLFCCDVCLTLTSG